ncbi:YdeI/OmpD-associated family protein [Agaribacillus aureus]|uniref:YdeI/OmpD-associated family protein n=1 Tax=Agaribacillus aureus TaxID=3051825 RepID=UPI003211A7A7
MKIDAATVNKFEKKRKTRLKCVIDNKISYSCGLNHFGDGNFFIIVATRQLKSLGKTLGDPVSFEIFEDPNPLGVEEPEVLLVLLDQDIDAKKVYDQLTDGKKRSLIYTIRGVKDIDKQVQKILTFLNQERIKAANKR